MFYAHAIPTPLGLAVAIVDDDNALVQLSRCLVEDPKSEPFLVQGQPVTWDQARLAPVAAQLEEYFGGERTSFDLPLALRGTPFQQRVWDELTRVPYGTTLSYKQLAQRVGSPNACRAVGGASGKNPCGLSCPATALWGQADY